MLASIVLDQNYPHFTNLDEISGKVFVRTPSSTNVSSIVVKLEGESRTRLLPPPNPNGDRQKPHLEFHKILYKVQMVFPPAHIIVERGVTVGKTTFTLPAGQHEYPFRFKFPFNNACNTSSSSNPTVSLFGGLNVDIVKTPLRHVKKTLPPTLSGFPGEAEIRYYVKATVSRPSLFKENARAYLPFNFCPIEPPRPPESGAQAYARRRHEFVSHHPGEVANTKSRMKHIFASKPSTTGAGRIDAPSIAVDIRLPEPAILTCATEVPLRIVLTSINGVKKGVLLESIQVELVAITEVRAQGVGRTERNGTVIISRGSLDTPIEFPEKADETELDPRLWMGQPIPNTIPPSFVTCNISRSYELLARIGLKYEVAGHPPQFLAVDLRLPVQMYSGVAPPHELLQAMAVAQEQTHETKSNKPALPARKPVPPPTQRPSSSPQGASTAQAGPPVYDDAPPSYEDAVANEMPSVNGPRREYAPPVAAEDPLLGSDEKSGLH